MGKKISKIIFVIFVLLLSDYTYGQDSTPPTVSLTQSTSDTLLYLSEVVTVTATFSENMTATPTISFSGLVTNALMSSTSSDSIWNYTYTVTSTYVTDTSVTVSGTDLAGNYYSGSESLTFKLDTVTPTIISLSHNATDTKLALSDHVTITAEFSEAMLVTPTISISNLVTDVLMSATESLTHWNYLYTVTSTLVTSTKVSVSGKDLAGNSYSGLDSITFEVDTTLPLCTVTQSTSDTLLYLSEVVTVTATFSENMTATPTISFSGLVTNALMSSTSSDSIWNYTYTVTSTYVTDTSVTVSGTDLAGNYYSGSESLTFKLDTVTPTIISLSHNATDTKLALSDHVTITAEFSEAMLVTPTISISNLVTDVLMTATESLTHWNYLYTVTSTLVTSTKVSVSGKDLAGNSYSGLDSITFEVDTTLPTFTVTHSAVDDIIILNETVTITIMFTESIIATPTISLTGIVSNAFLNQISGTNSYTFNFTASSSLTSITSTTATVRATDLAGNNYSGNNSLTLEIDVIPPTIIEFNDSDNNNWVKDSDTVIFTLEFSEAMATAPQISSNPNITNITSQTMTASSSLVTDSTWTYSWDVPTGDQTSISITASGTDVAGNPYIITIADTLIFNLDNTDPIVSNIINARDNDVLSGLKPTPTNELSIIFNEIVREFEIDDISPSVGSVSDLTYPTGLTSETKRFVFSPPASNSSNVNFTVNNFEDRAGNQISSPYNKIFNLDNVSPTISITTNDILVNAFEQATITFSLSEPTSKTIFIGDINVTSAGSLSNFTKLSSTSYEATFTPANATTNSVTISIRDNKFDDAARNFNVASSTTFNVDTEPPTIISLSSSDIDNLVRNTQTISITAVFNENIANTPTISISGLVTDVGMSVLSSSDSTTWFYDWSVPAGNDGIVNATVSGTDIALNPYTGSDKLEIEIDNTGPSIVSTTINSENDEIKLVWDEPIYLDPSYNSKDHLTIVSSGGNGILPILNFITKKASTSNTLEINISSIGVTNGDELLTINPKNSNPYIRDIVGNIASNSQSSNTVNLNNTPPKITGLSINTDNTSATITFNEEVFIDSSASSSNLTASDFSLSISGGTAILNSINPTIVTKGTSSFTYVLGISLNSNASGEEILTVTPANNSIYDNKGEQVDINNITQSNTVFLNDKLGPEFTSIKVDRNTNKDVDLAFNGGTSRLAGSIAGLSANIFKLQQTAGVTLTITVSEVIKVSGGATIGGEDKVRLIVDLNGKIPSGNEVYKVTTHSGTTFFDTFGNSFNESKQTINTFSYFPPTNGGVSVSTSTINISQNKVVANNINEVTLTVQTKDASGVDFFSGGYSIKIIGPDGEMNTLDNGNGSYSAVYRTGTINASSQNIAFTFSYDGVTSKNKVNLLLMGDVDGDGVGDVDDICPNTKPNTYVDQSGCADSQKDSDNDGVTDDLDECPNTPEFESVRVYKNSNTNSITFTYDEVAVVVNSKGCALSEVDTDFDGIFDNLDNCPENPNSDQLDKDNDGIGDICDTDNPLPKLISFEVSTVEFPTNGKIIGKLNVFDPMGDLLSYFINSPGYGSVLQINENGEIVVIGGDQLSFESFNGKILSVNVFDGTNNISFNTTLKIDNIDLPPLIDVTIRNIKEDAPVESDVAYIRVEDPQGGEVFLSIEENDFFELIPGGTIITKSILDFETNTSHDITIIASGEKLSSSEIITIYPEDVPNMSYFRTFSISVFDLVNEIENSKVDHSRYFHPYHKKNIISKIQTRIVGGVDADKFIIRNGSQQKDNGFYSEGYLEFVNPPDYENPADDDGNNIYEVTVEYINLDDGSNFTPIPVTQNNIFIPENSKIAIELQSIATAPDQDSDGDGVLDVVDNSPLVSNPDQVDEDGDGVGDVSDDFDHDGVWNPLDQCPDTPLGELVGLDGCIILNLPAQNFKLYKTEKCAATNSIAIDIVDTSYTYVMTLSGPGTNRTESFTDSTFSFDGLSAGTYSLYVTVDGVDSNEFERFFEVTIREPEPLSIYAGLSNKSNNLTLSMKGGQVYNITHNGKTTQTSKSEITLTLKNGNNSIRVDTGLECQGVFNETFFNSSDVQIAPNPFNDEINIFVGGDDTNLTVDIFTPGGSLIHTEQCRLDKDNRVISIPTSNYPQGSYNVTIKGETTLQSIQVVKE